MPAQTETGQLDKYPETDRQFLQEVTKTLDRGNDQPPLPPTEGNHDNGGRRGRGHSRLKTAILLGAPTAVTIVTLIAEALTNVAR